MCMAAGVIYNSCGLAIAQNSIVAVLVAKATNSPTHISIFNAPVYGCTHHCV